MALRKDIIFGSRLKKPYKIQMFKRKWRSYGTKDRHNSKVKID